MFTSVCVLIKHTIKKHNALLKLAMCSPSYESLCNMSLSIRSIQIVLFVPSQTVLEPRVHVVLCQSDIKINVPAWEEMAEKKCLCLLPEGQQLLMAGSSHQKVSFCVLSRGSCEGCGLREETSCKTYTVHPGEAHRGIYSS